jgi:geranylgeranyl diphosphate synthase, type II
LTATLKATQFLEEQRTRIDTELDRLLPAEEAYPPSIHRAMRHSLFAGGKRLRPLLCLEAGGLMGGDEQALLQIGCALEMIHTYSLIHDDLPALDNDDLRRGKATCHREFGEATAILAGDALQTLAYEVLSSTGSLPAERRLRLIHEVAQATGTRAGMIAGQVVDLEMARRPINAASLKFIHSAKTGALLRAAVRAGAITAGAAEPDLERLTIYGEKTGLAFQIADDLLDELGSSAELGKTAGKDQHQGKSTYPALYGIEESRRTAARLVEEACEALEVYGRGAERLQGIAHFLIERTS